MNVWANKAMQSSMPIIRPMWMLNPQSDISHTLDDQFFVGDKVLIYRYFTENFERYNQTKLFLNLTSN